MTMKRNILFLLVSMLVFASCDDLFEPAIENTKDLEIMYDDEKFALGLLISGYRSLPNAYDNTEYATDDAVTNIKGDPLLEMATGSWTASNNPVNFWGNGFGAIQYLNTFLAGCDKVQWAEDAEVSELFRRRMKGEAYGLRGLYYYYLVRNHAGFTTDGQLLGVPILTEPQDIDSDFDQPRASFQACMNQILSDLDSAEYYLPDVYVNVSSVDEVPEKYKAIVTSFSKYNRTLGDLYVQLFDGQITRAMRSRATLLAASPAFQDASNAGTWEDAAIAAAEVLEYIGGIAGLDPTGHTFFNNTGELDKLDNGINPAEILWRGNIDKSAFEQEEANFPPSINKSKHGGNMNPTQNLVDAFPDANGYPITDAATVYSADNPYANRDPRLTNIVVYDGSALGVGGDIIKTGSASTTIDGINATDHSTRTGYYLKKRLRMDVNYNEATGSWQEKNNYTPRIRYTEIFLNYAEAANEAYGPTGTAPGVAYSAVDVIRAIRARARGNVNDPYLDAITGDKAKMRELIRNERRIELCFEGFRFWDLRRWNANLNITAQGYDASTREVFDVETRSYSDYMNYCPIPYSEMLKFDNLVQNKGWE